MNEFDHCVLAMKRHHSGQGSNPQSGLNFSGVSCCCLSSAKMPLSNSFIPVFISNALKILVLSSSNKPLVGNTLPKKIEKK